MGIKDRKNTKMKEKNTKQNKKSNIQKAISETAVNETSLLERSKYTLDLVNGWILSADTKVSISSGVFSIIVTIMAFVADKILNNVDKTNGVNKKFFIGFLISLSLAIILFLVSELFLFLAIKPNLIEGKNNKEKSEVPTFSIYYSEICRFKNAEDYIFAARNSSEKQFEDEVLKEVYCNSKICLRKMVRFRWGLWLGLISIVSIIACSFFYYLSYTIH